uniref:small monomeric GTPase n=1 Tax=Moschus moschiferus TaxID=68415 RepID=A0A8C6FYG4_MOSMO
MASAGDPPTGQRDAADQNFDYTFKLLLIGNSSVGKTSFLFRYANDSFTPAFVSTVGIDFKVKTVYRHKRIKLQIRDTAGQERYRTITTAYYRGAMGFLLMYDVANQESFAAVQDWATLPSLSQRGKQLHVKYRHMGEYYAAVKKDQAILYALQSTDIWVSGKKQTTE